MPAAEGAILHTVGTAGGASTLVLRLAVLAPTRIIGRLAAIAGFPEVPAAVATDVARRGCRIPQAEGLPEHQNVIQGEFKRRGQRDWAVLCLAGNTSTILVYWNGSAKDPAEFAPMDETIAPSKDGYYRILQLVSAKFIRKHYVSGLGPEPPRVIDHDGIDDGIFGKGSSVHYFYQGKWLEFGGED